MPEGVLDSLPLWIALLPLAGYLTLLAAAHLRRRPSLVSGTWDALLLAGAVAGLAFAGPLALVQPAFGPAPWNGLVALLGFGLVVAVCILAARPRLVVYNITAEQLRPFVAEVAATLDPRARWAGTSVALPTRQLELQLDGGPLRCVSVVAVGERAAHDCWTEFGRRLRQAVRRTRVRPSPWAGVFIAAAGGIFAAAAWLALRG